MEIKVKEQGYIVYQMTTYQGEVEIEGQEITYRYSEDDNGSSFYILTENGWEENIMDEDPKYLALYAAVMEAGGNPEWLEDIEIDSKTMEFYA